MATEAANAERYARAQHDIDGHMQRVGRVLGFAAPPRGRADTKDAKNCAEAERIETFLRLVADAVDPSNAGKGVQTQQSLGGIGDGYNHQDEEQRQAAEKLRQLSLRTSNTEEEYDTGGGSGQTSAPLAGEESQGDDDEPHFAGKALSEFDNVPDEQLTEQDGVGEVTAKEIVKARRKRDRRAGK